MDITCVSSPIMLTWMLPCKFSCPPRFALKEFKAISNPPWGIDILSNNCIILGLSVVLSTCKNLLDLHFSCDSKNFPIETALIPRFLLSENPIRAEAPPCGGSEDWSQSVRPLDALHLLLLRCSKLAAKKRSRLLLVLLLFLLLLQRLAKYVYNKI